MNGQRSRFARIDLRQAAVAYAEVAGDEDDEAWTAAWERLAKAARAYASAVDVADRAKAEAARSPK